ncbi:DUF4376 domain-containing protein [Methylobacterium soli]|uniref:DUF4376 domain-containing protein n=1 Tax=Methylobacterium soli TaxID=553447 RepID=A0A6L3T388_9HYPH|nr:DUF4376 domain-containing protein [Methylobacterium soli]KAB1079402.1 DUF4376 domain-containing protein [Methylobacterium soli]
MERAVIAEILDAHGVVRNRIVADRDFLDVAHPGLWREVPAQPSLDDARQRKLADLAIARWQHEVGGTSLAGAPLATDEKTILYLTAAQASAKEDPGFSIRWKVAPGQFETFDAATIEFAAMTARAHVQACFDREEALTAAILAAADQAALDAIDITAGWP